MPPDSDQRSQTVLVLWIVLGVFVWGTFQAIGAYLLNWNVWRAVIVLGCVNGFLAFWLFLLWLNRRRRGDIDP